MKRLLPLSMLFATLPALATPFASGDAAAGEKLHAQKCSSCHTARFGGDGSTLYTRANRRAKNASALAQMITTCNANLGNTLFPEDEANLGAWLNQRYYRFK